jgi:hypothetical protein
MQVLQAVILHNLQRAERYCLSRLGDTVCRGEWGEQRTRRINRHGRAGRRGAGAEIGTALMNHEP